MKRTWQVGPFQDDDGQLYPISDQERDREMVSIGWLIDRMGGSVVIAPLRLRESAPDGDKFTTAGLAVKYDSGNVPAVEAQQPEPLAHEQQPGVGIERETASDSATSDEAAKPEAASESTDFPGQPRGRGDTITVVPPEPALAE